MITITTVEQQLKWSPTYPSKQVMGIYCVPEAPPDSPLMQLVLKKTNMNGAPQQVLRAVGSLRRATSVFAYSAAAAVIFSIMYIIILSRFAKCLIYSSLFVAVFASACLTIFFLATAYDADKTEIVPHEASLSGIVRKASIWLHDNRLSNPVFQSMSLRQAVIWSYATGCITGLLTLCMLCTLCCAGRTLETAAALVDTAADCMLSMWSVVLEAVIDMVLRLVLLFSLMYGLFWVVSCGDVHADSGATIGDQRVTGMTRSLSFSKEQQYMIAYYVFGCFWIMELANAIGQFVISYMVVLWYYTPKESGRKIAPLLALPRAYCAAFFCHLGSLAIGSFSIAMVRMAKVALGALAANANAKGNKALECIAKSLGCILECFQNCMEFINKNAYVDIAINSNNFCMAAKHSFTFMFSNPGEIVLLNGSCLIFQVIGVFSVMGLTGGLAYFGVTHSEEYYSPTSQHYVAAPMLVSAVAACMGGLIATVFMLVFDQTADTLLYTFTWNKSKGGPSATNLYAPDSLLRIESKTAGYTPLMGGHQFGGVPDVHPANVHGDVYGSHSLSGRGSPPLGLSTPTNAYPY